MTASFGHTWWGRAWVEALEASSGVDPARLDRGRTYARQDRVETLTIEAGQVSASVRGSRRLHYRTHLDLRSYDDAAWAPVVAAIAASAGHTAALLDGDLDPGVVDAARAAGVELLPTRGDLRLRCSCPDRAEPCKHAAALCYLIAEALDDDPFVLFTLRGRTKTALLDELHAARRQGAAGDGAAAETDDVLASLAAAGPLGTGADPGEVARAAWSRDRGPLPVLGELPAAPGAPAAWPDDPPIDAPFDPPGLLVLAADAAHRAWAQLRGDGTSALDLTRDADLARRGSVSLEAHQPLPSVAVGDRRAQGDLTHRALAWRHGGEDGLAMIDEDPWRPPVADMAAARAAIEDAGVSPAVLTVTNNRITGPGFQLRLSRAGQWWRFEKHKGRWEVAAPPADAADDLLLG